MHWQEPGVEEEQQQQQRKGTDSSSSSSSSSVQFSLRSTYITACNRTYMSMLKVLCHLKGLLTTYMV
jgi:hypothetical protein